MEEDVLHSEKAHFAMATTWSRVHYALGIPGALLAAVAGVSALQQWPGMAAAMAIGAAVLTTLITFLDPEKVRSDHHAAGIRYNVLRGKLRRLCQIDLKVDSPASGHRAKLEELAEERAAIMQSSRHIGGLAFKLGKRSIGRGEHEYGVDASNPGTGVR